MLDYIRIACAVPRVKVGDVMQNTRDICEFMARADAQKADLLVLPELSLTGYSCGDLFLQDSLWQATSEGLEKIVECSKAYPRLTTVVGMPVRLNAKLLNCAVAVARGGVLGIVPKTYLSGNEGRWFVSGAELKETAAGLDVFGWKGAGYCSLGTDLLIELGDGAVLGMEICEDMFAPIPPSSVLALNGANVIVNLSASDALAGKGENRTAAIRHQSFACNCIYAYCSAGYTESTADVVYSGYSAVAEKGRVLAENRQTLATDYMIVQDCDLGKVRCDRQKNPTFRFASASYGSRQFLIEPMRGDRQLRSDGSLYPVRRLPFVPESPEAALARGREIFELQVTALMQRLSLLNAKAVLGISGGLDSTLALLVAAEAVKRLGRPKTDVHGITMPCFGTSERTHGNAWRLMELLGITAREIRIADAVNLHFENIGHDSAVHNATYENAQARERTQILMDYAGTVGGIVVGTGDLSELALGWCTYNGDHMSMYAVNCDIPKTLIPWVIRAAGQLEAFLPCVQVLQDVVDTPISPELLPPDAQGRIAQQTEDLVGPYALHDFYLYYAVRYGFSPRKIYALACRAFAGEYTAEEIKKWLQVFYKRFFTQQFKRNCLPDGVKVGIVALGGKEDWKMPSDGCAALWLEELEKL